MNPTITRIALTVVLTGALSAGTVHARGFRGGAAMGGFRGGGMGGFRGAEMGGFRAGGMSGYRGGMGGFEGARGGFGGEAFRGGSAGMSSLGRTPSFSDPGTFNRAGGQFRGYNPYASGSQARGGAFAEGPAGGRYGAGYRGGSYTGPRGTSVDYGAAGRGVIGPEGGAAGRGIAGVHVNTPGGRSFTDVDRAGGAVGPRGNAVAGRSNITAASGPRGAAVTGSRGVVAAGPGGVAAAGERGGVAVGARGAAGYRAYGAAGYRPYGYNAYGAYHAGWVHGYWNGHNSAVWGWRSPYWGAWGLAGAGLGWGLPIWGFGSSLYSMGYMPYVNPYYMAVNVDAGAVPYNYSQPIDTVSAPAPEDVTSEAVALSDSARESFRQGDYNQALQQTDAALAKTPNDTALHEFRALCLFALQRYDEAAATLYAVLSVGPGWDWSTLIGLYPDTQTYTTQLRALENACEANPESAADWFVLAYHYLTQGNTDAAVQVLQQVVNLKPDDSLSAKLLAQLSPPPPADSTEEAPPQESPADQPADTTPPPGASLTGTWTAQPTADTTVSLSLQPNDTFTWNVTQNGKSQSFTGTSTYGDGLLTLAQDNGPVLVGRVSWTDPSHMTFRIAGDGPQDPGLSFAR